jgi:predicted dehydrogenase
MKVTWSPDQPLRVLLVGLGSIGQRHARNLRQLLGDRVTLTAYRTRGLDLVIGDASALPHETVAQRYRITETTDLDQALAERPHVAFICNPSGLHLPIARRAADAGCHLFIEKPVSDSMMGVADLAKAVDEKGLVAYVGCQLRFHPCLQRLRTLLETRAVGSVMAARIHMGECLEDWHPYEDYRQSYAARRELGGGVLLTLIHEIDYAYWLFGAPQRLFAVGGHLSKLDVNVEDTVSVLMACKASGRVVPVHIQLSFGTRPASRGCEILADGGSVAVDLSEAKLFVRDGNGQVIENFHLDTFGRNDLFLAELTHFLRCLSGEEQPIVPLGDGIETLRIALAARDSMQEHRLMEMA